MKPIERGGSNTKALRSKIPSMVENLGIFVLKFHVLVHSDALFLKLTMPSSPKCIMHLTSLEGRSFLREGRGVQPLANGWAEFYFYLQGGPN